MITQRNSMQIFVDELASVGSQLLEHNLTDAGSVWNNTEQLIAQLQAIRDAFVLRQAGLDSSSVRVAEHATNNDEHAHPLFLDHLTNDFVRPTNHAHLDFETAMDADAATDSKVTPTSRELIYHPMSPMRVRKRRPHFRPVTRPQTITVSLSLSTCPGRSSHPPGCSCSSVYSDALCPPPSRTVRVLVEVSLSPAHTCLDPPTLLLGCSCSQCGWMLFAQRGLPHPEYLWARRTLKGHSDSVTTIVFST
jgi:hypothetical protein